LQQDLEGGNLRLGVMGTAVNRRLRPGLETLHDAAYSGGFDFVRQWHDKKWYVAGTLAGSRVEGSPAALLATQTSSKHYFQRPDNSYESVDSTRTSLMGHAGAMRLGKASGKHWRFESGVAWRSPGFEINDVGYLRRSDEINQFTWVGYSIRNPFAIFRRFNLNGNQWVDWDFGGTNLIRQANTNTNMTFKNNWELGGGTTRTWEHVSNDALRGGPSALLPGQWSSWAWAGTDSRRHVYASFGSDWGTGDDDSGGYQTAWIDLTVRPSNAWRIALSPSYINSRDDLQYVDTTSSSGDPRYLFGHIDQETAALTVRLDYTIRPNLTLQFYGAPFVSAGSYSAFKRITDPRAARYGDRFHTFTDSEISYDPATRTYTVDENSGGGVYSFGLPDFNYRDFNANLVLRWEFQPGSVFYGVWSQARTDIQPHGSFEFGNDLHGLFDNQGDNVFLIKISKWFAL